MNIFVPHSWELNWNMLHSTSELVQMLLQVMPCNVNYQLSVNQICPSTRIKKTRWETDYHFNLRDQVVLLRLFNHVRQSVIDPPK